MPSGLRQTPLGARKPVARISVRPAVLADLQQRAVLRHDGRQAVAGRLGVIEVPLGVGLQAHRELVEVLGDLVVAVEALVEVGLAVAVEVAEADDLVAAADVDLARRRSSGPAAGTAPTAIRRQVRPRAGSSSPPTSQTSPSQVQTAARWPSGRKSKPEGRIWQSQGLLSGSVRTSTANGPSSRPMIGLRLEDLGPSLRAAVGERARAASGAGEAGAYASQRLRARRRTSAP